MAAAVLAETRAALRPHAVVHAWESLIACLSDCTPAAVAAWRVECYKAATLHATRPRDECAHACDAIARVLVSALRDAVEDIERFAGSRAIAYALCKYEPPLDNDDLLSPGICALARAAAHASTAVVHRHLQPGVVTRLEIVEASVTTHAHARALYSATADYVRQLPPVQ